MKLPAGKYFVGDPCYCFDKSWHEVLEKSDCLGEFYEKDGAFCAARQTMHGDGGYEDWFGGKYSVDSGMIGVTDFRLIERFDDLERLGRVFQFYREFEVSESDGVITIGKFKIDTN